MKKQILTIILVLATGFAFAQSPISKGESQINLGVGFHRGAFLFILD